MRLPPQDIEAEKRVLGCLMLSPPHRIRVEHILESSYFYNESHGKYYEIIMTTPNPDVLTVSDKALQQGLCTPWQVKSFVSQLNDFIDMARIETILNDALIIAEKALLRKAIHEATNLIEAIYESEAKYECNKKKNMAASRVDHYDRN